MPVNPNPTVDPEAPSDNCCLCGGGLTRIPGVLHCCPDRVLPGRISIKFEDLGTVTGLFFVQSGNTYGLSWNSRGSGADWVWDGTGIPAGLHLCINPFGSSASDVEWTVTPLVVPATFSTGANCGPFSNTGDNGPWVSLVILCQETFSGSGIYNLFFGGTYSYWDTGIGGPTHFFQTINILHTSLVVTSRTLVSCNPLQWVLVLSDGANRQVRVTVNE